MRQRVVKSDVDDGDDAHESSVTRTARRALKKVDVYPKMHREFKVQTEFGATVSIVAGIVMAILFLSELSAYLSVNTHEHMVVDSSLGEKLQVNLDVSFLAVNCRDAHINAMDVAGELQVNMHQTVVKTRLDANGNSIGNPSSEDLAKTDMPAGYCGSCYEAKHPAGKECCNTCEEVKEAFIHSDLSLEEAEQKDQCLREIMEAERLAQDGEGCRFTGKMFVNRVAGNFHVALGRTFHRQGRLVHQFRPGQEHTYNSSHVIHSLSFGEPVPGVVGPLDGVSKSSVQPGGVFQYYIKIVPTIYSDIDENAIHSYQFSVTQQGSEFTPQSCHSIRETFIDDLLSFIVARFKVPVKLWMKVILDDSKVLEDAKVFAASKEHISDELSDLIAMKVVEWSWNQIESVEIDDVIRDDIANISKADPTKAFFHHASNNFHDTFSFFARSSKLFLNLVPKVGDFFQSCIFISNLIELFMCWTVLSNIVL